MSKKNKASRSAMTLKDFHGGSIPSDLPLPSAPGMTVDRSVFERQGSGTWMSPTLGRGYSNDRSAYHRQGSSTGVRTFEDKASYFPNPANIGRNYDEDERKPVDSRPRSGHGADRFDDHSYDERRGGGYLGDRYPLEDQANFSEGRGSGASDRFPPSQVAGGGFDSDVYVHDEFGLIPVGPPPSRGLPPQDLPSRPQPPSYQREIIPETRVESSYLQIQQQMPSVPPPYTSSQQIAASPPRSWRNPAHQVQQNPAPAASSQPTSDSSTNVWTAKRDGGDYNKVQAPEVSSNSLGSSSPWRPHSIAGRAVDKVSAGRWQADSTRPSPGRWQPDSSREPVHKPAAAEELSAGFGAYGTDTARQSYVEDVNDTHRYVGSDPDRVGHSGTGRTPYVDSRGGHNLDDGRPDVNDQNKAGYRDVNAAGFGYGGNGSRSSNGRVLPSEPSAQSAGDRSRFSEDLDSSLPAATETGRESSQPELTERPKLKLLPRSKPLEVETPKAETEIVVKHEETSRKVLGQSDSIQQAEVQDAEAPKREPVGASDETVERPKLNLKPRSQPPEAEAVEGSEKVRRSVFGGARPRELVLKERGADDVVNGPPDVAVTPGTPSIPAPPSSDAKVETIKYQRPEPRSDEKLDDGRYERPDRSYERQGSHRVDRQDSARGDRGLEGKWDREKDNQWEQERPDGLRRREFDRQDSKRDTESRRDIDKQESWRRPADSPAPSAVSVKNSGSALLSLVDPSPRGSGRPASAVDLAQAYSRSTSLSSTMTGSARGNITLRTPLSPIPKGSIQGFTPGYGNGTASRDAPFSRLAEASPPPYAASSAEMFLQGSGYGLDNQSSYFGSGKLGGYPSSDLKRGSSFGRAETGREFMEENGDFPGKRGLPVRQRDGYFD